MKRLMKVDCNIPWHPRNGEGRLYITDEIPTPFCATAFGFTFDGDRILMTRLRKRGWDIPGGVIEPGETPEQAAIRETLEEASVEVQIVEPIGIQELEVFGPKPEGYRWPFPISVQVMYLCRPLEFGPFLSNLESHDRALFLPDEARAVPTMLNHREIYEEALRRVQGNG